MSNQSECMYCVFSFIAEEKIGGFQPRVESSADASRAWWVPNSRVVVLAGRRRRGEARVLGDVVRPAHADEPALGQSPRAEPSVPSVLIRQAMLCVLHETIWRNRSSPGTSASSLIPIA